MRAGGPEAAEAAAEAACLGLPGDDDPALWDALAEVPDPEEDGAPEITPVEVPSWRAYMWLTTWADGMGGMDAGALERYLSIPPASRLPEPEKERVWRLVPVLINEDRKIMAEERERARRRGRAGK